MGSITRTINELLGLGPLNLEDALAGEFTGVFTQKTQPDRLHLPAQRYPCLRSRQSKNRAKPKTKQEAAALRDMDDSPEIQKQLEKSKGTLRRPSDKDDD